jgi:hypothetical protein
MSRQPALTPWHQGRALSSSISILLGVEYSFGVFCSIDPNLRLVVVIFWTFRLPLRSLQHTHWRLHLGSLLHPMERLARPKLHCDAVLLGSL